MYMVDWKERLDEFLQLNRLKILKNSGTIPHKKMEEMVKAGRIVQPSAGAVPRYKRYLDEVRGIAIALHDK